MPVRKCVVDGLAADAAWWLILSDDAAVPVSDSGVACGHLLADSLRPVSWRLLAGVPHFPVFALGSTAPTQLQS